MGMRQTEHDTCFIDLELLQQCRSKPLLIGIILPPSAIDRCEQERRTFGGLLECQDGEAEWSMYALGHIVFGRTPGSIVNPDRGRDVAASDADDCGRGN